MNTSQRCWLLLIGTGLFAFSGASCPGFLQQQQAALPRALPPSPTLEQVIEVVNRNNSKIRTFSADSASLSGSGFPRLSASIAYERPQRLRLRASSLAGAEFDVGSNDELFWFWLRRSQPPTIYFCRHDQFAASQARLRLPVELRWLIEGLGVAEFDPALPHQGPYPLPNDRLQITTIRQTAQGEPATKVTVIDGSQGWILEQHLYDARRRLLVSSTAGGHQREPYSGLVMPTVVEINCPAQPAGGPGNAPAQPALVLKINLGNVQINRQLDDRPGLWTMPNYPGATPVDIADPRFRPQVIGPEGAVSQRDRMPPPSEWRAMR